MKYFMGIAPPADIQAQLDDLRRRYPGRHADHIEPHITLIPPADYTETAEWLHALQSVLKKHAPFFLSLGSCAWFGQRVLYLSVLPAVASEGAPVPSTDPLGMLRQDLLDRTNSWRAQCGLGSQSEERPFRPHVTLAMSSFGTGFDDMKKLAREADELSRALASFPVNAVRVYARQKARWERYDDLALAGSNV